MDKRNKDKRAISEMRNLGPAAEFDLNAAGIMCAEDVIRLGPVETFIRMLQGRQNQGRSPKCCNASYLYAIHGAIHDIDWRKIPDDRKAEYKTLAAEIRASGHFSS